MTGMTVIPFPTSGLGRRDLAIIEEFCARRRERGIASYPSARTIDETGPGGQEQLYAVITDQPHGRTVFIIDRTEGVYRARYFDSVKRRAAIVAEGRSLYGVLQAIPEWPAAPFRNPGRRPPERPPEW